MEATPAEGYQFRGWYNETTGKRLNEQLKCSLSVTADCTITARFVPNDTARFDVDGPQFFDLREAVEYAGQTSKNKITLIKSGSLLAGEYTIPADVTLLIPCDDAHTVFTEMPGSTGNVKADKTQKVYTKLTMASGTKLVVNGAISVAANVSSANSGYTALPTGEFGQIEMQEGASIVLESRSNLYCWGFITGKVTL